VPDDTFSVARFEGREALSEPYHFRLELVAADPNLNADAVVNQPATLEIERDGDVSRVHGLVVRFEQHDHGPEFVNYVATLVPRLDLLGLVRQDRIFQEMTVLEIVEQVLKDNGLAPDTDFEIRAAGSYPTREYTVQYHESDLDFVQRLLEYDGLCYFFIPGEDVELLVVADGKDQHPAVGGENSVPFRDARAVNAGGETVGSFNFAQQVLPKEVRLKDYNYRKPELAVKGESAADAAGAGSGSEYGQHFKDPEEGARLATVRAEEILCRRRIFSGRSACRHFRAGQVFTLTDHFRDASNGDFLLLEVWHTGEQPGVLGTAYGGEADRPAYTNEFRAIPAAVQFRPPRLTPRPRISGVMHANVDAASDGHYADLDEHGRYKVKIPFDLSDLKDGKASRYVRMAQPYGGQGDAERHYGFHFPLHKGTEVLLTHLDGDPDRPIIAAAVPNPVTASPVGADNQTQSVLRTAAQNERIVEDEDDAQYWLIHTPRHTTHLSLGESHARHDCPNGIVGGTEKGAALHGGEGLLLTGGTAAQVAGAEAADQAFQDVAATAQEVTEVAALCENVTTSALERFGDDSLLQPPAQADEVKAGSYGQGIYAVTATELALAAGAAVVIGAGASADIVAAGPASLVSKEHVLVAGTAGVGVAARQNVELVSGEGDMFLTTNTGAIEITAKKNMVVTVEEETFALTATGAITGESSGESITLTAGTALTLVASGDALTAQAKGKVEITSEEDDLVMASKQKNVSLEGSQEVAIKCGQASITLKQDGSIEIKGIKVEIKADSEFKASGAMFTLEAQAMGTVKASGMLECSASGNTIIKGAMVMIN
jgi:type VI secretion system VgrG family protein